MMTFAKTVLIQRNPDLRQTIGRSLSQFIPLISAVSSNLAAELESIQKQYDMFDGGLNGSLDVALMQGVNFAALQFQNSVLDGPTLTSRAGLYIYLSALVSSPDTRVSKLVVIFVACRTASRGR